MPSRWPAAPAISAWPTDARAPHGPICEHADFAAEQLTYALDVLEARGELDPASPEAQQFVLDYLTDTTMHEVGHTLGLRHNFRSRASTPTAQLSDRDSRPGTALAGSVMEYAPINLPLPGELGGTPFQTALGPYDYWAIEYAYKPIARGRRGGRAAAHRRAQRRAAAGLRHRRGQLPRHRPRVAALRPRRRPGRLRQEAHRRSRAT